MGLFEVDPVARHHGLVEGKAGFRAVPVDEFADRMVVERWELSPMPGVMSQAVRAVAEASYNQYLWMHHLNGDAAYLPV